jgi:hypothetical protein
MVVNPMIDGSEFTKYLMDGRSSINIMYIGALKKMYLSETQLKNSNFVFYGVVLG